MKLSQITKKLEKRFPSYKAEPWDNVGLLVGEREADIKKVQISLDATEKVIDRAISRGVDLIITHHPLIFSPVKSVNDTSLTGRKILKLIKNKIALYSMHTNLDSAEEGLNDYIARLLGSEDSKIIDGQYSKMHKLALYTPEESMAEILKKIDRFGLEINGYKGVSYTTECTERYMKFGEEQMYINSNKKIEVIGEKNILSGLLNEIKKIHPYEEMSYEIMKIENKYENGGIGRIFSLKTPTSLNEYVEFLKSRLEIKNVKVATPDENKMIKKIAVVNGSGMSFLKKAKRGGADLFITGDIKYHEALDAVEEGLSLVDLGHYESEEFFHQLITPELKEFDSLEVEVYNADPVFKYV